MSETVREIPLDRVTVHPKNPRRQVDATSDPELQALATSIRAQGVLQPILVVRDGDNFLAVIGSRRLAASRIAGRSTIPAIVRDWTEGEAATASLTENVRRLDLDAIERAQGYQDLIELNDWTQAQLAKHVGTIKQPTVANALRLLRLPDDSPIRAALVERRITEAHALVAMQLRDPRLLAQLALRKDVTVRELRMRVRILKGLRLAKGITAVELRERVERLIAGATIAAARKRLAPAPKRERTRAKTHPTKRPERAKGREMRQRLDALGVVRYRAADYWAALGDALRATAHAYGWMGIAGRRATATTRKALARTIGALEREHKLRGRPVPRRPLGLGPQTLALRDRSRSPKRG